MATKYPPEIEAKHAEWRAAKEAEGMPVTPIRIQDEFHKNLGGPRGLYVLTKTIADICREYLTPIASKNVDELKKTLETLAEITEAFPARVRTLELRIHELEHSKDVRLRTLELRIAELEADRAKP